MIVFNGCWVIYSNSKQYFLYFAFITFSTNGSQHGVILQRIISKNNGGWTNAYINIITQSSGYRLGSTFIAAPRNLAVMVPGQKAVKTELTDI